jgi:hypothetical protein
MSRFFQWVAALGQNIQFVAFAAHAGVGALAILTLSEYAPQFGSWPAIVLIVGGGIKEFYFDAKYETNPPQTFTDNLEDFVGWGLGALLGWWMTGWLR